MRFEEKKMLFTQNINRIPLVYEVIGLTELAKAFGMQGHALTTASFAIALQGEPSNLRKVDQDCCNGVFFPHG